MPPRLTTRTIDLLATNDDPTTTGIANVADVEDAPPRVIDLNAAFSDVDSAARAIAGG